MIALRLPANANSVPPKEPPPAFSIMRGRLPQSFHSLQSLSLTRFTLIYPSCSGSRLATGVPFPPRWESIEPVCRFLKEFPFARLNQHRTVDSTSRNRVHLQYINWRVANDNHSSPQRNPLNQGSSFRVGLRLARPSPRDCCKGAGGTRSRSPRGAVMIFSFSSADTRLLGSYRRSAGYIQSGVFRMDAWN